MSDISLIKKIILADTDELLARILRYHLREAGFETVYTDKLSEVSGLIEKENPMAVIFEVVMPDMSGFELLERVKRRPPLMIVLTGLSQPEDVERVCCLGADLCFLKEKTTMKQVIRDILKKIS